MVLEDILYKKGQKHFLIETHYKGNVLKTNSWRKLSKYEALPEIISFSIESKFSKFPKSVEFEQKERHHKFTNRNILKIYFGMTSEWKVMKMRDIQSFWCAGWMHNYFLNRQSIFRDAQNLVKKLKMNQMRYIRINHEENSGFIGSMTSSKQ